MDTREELGSGGVEKVGLKGSFLKHTCPDGQKETIQLEDFLKHQTAIKHILDVLTSEKYGAVKSLNEIDAVGHRVVHGGEKFVTSVLITDEVIEMLEECSKLAPLHNPPNLAGIGAISELLPEIPQVAVFDTSYHQTIPKHAYMYAIPYSLYEKHGIRRYGFHGTSHRYVSRQACDFLGLDYEKSKIITAHIGNGVSVTAIENGKSVDTSMGFTPLEGLMMGTRSGDVDLGVASFLLEKKEISNALELSDLFNKQSGVWGISGISSDMREIESAVKEDNERAKLAMSMYNYRIKKYISSYIGALNGVDVIVFTGGVGENQTGTREYVCEGLSWMGIEIDKELNAKTRGKEALLTTPNSRVKVVVIPTDEEYMIASDTLEIVEGK